MIWADSKQVNEVVGLCRRRPDIITETSAGVRVRVAYMAVDGQCYDGGCISIRGAVLS